MSELLWAGINALRMRLVRQWTNIDYEYTRPYQRSCHNKIKIGPPYFKNLPHSPVDSVFWSARTQSHTYTVGFKWLKSASHNIASTDSTQLSRFHWNSLIICMKWRWASQPASQPAVKSLHCYVYYTHCTLDIRWLPVSTLLSARGTGYGIVRNSGWNRWLSALTFWVDGWIIWSHYTRHSFDTKDWLYIHRESASSTQFGSVQVSIVTGNQSITLVSWING